MISILVGFFVVSLVLFSSIAVVILILDRDSKIDTLNSNMFYLERRLEVKDDYIEALETIVEIS